MYDVALSIRGLAAGLWSLYNMSDNEIEKRNLAVEI